MTATSVEYGRPLFAEKQSGHHADDVGIRTPFGCDNATGVRGHFDEQ
jgi:hypothetical protein